MWFAQVPNKELSGSIGKSSHVFQTLRIAEEIAMHDINGNAEVLEDYDFNVAFIDTSPGTIVNVITKYLDLMKTNRTHLVVLGEVISSNTEILAGLTNLYNIPQISHASSSDSVNDNTKHPNLYSIRKPLSFGFNPLIQMLKEFKWNNVGILSSNSFVKMSTILLDKLKKEEIAVLEDGIIRKDEEGVNRTLQYFEENDVRIIIAVMVNDEALNVICTAHRTTKLTSTNHVWLLITPVSFSHSNYLQNTTQYGCTENEIKSATETVFSFYPFDIVTTQPERNIFSGKTVKELLDEIRGRHIMGVHEDDVLLPMLAYDAVWLAATTLNHVATNMNLSEISLKTKDYLKEFQHAIKGTHFDGASGDIHYPFKKESKYSIYKFTGANITAGKSSIEVVGVYEESYGTIKWFKDIFSSTGVVPSDGYHHFKQSEVSITESLRYTFISISCLCILVQITSIGCQLLLCEKIVFGASKPFINCTIFIGCILLEVSVIIMSLDVGIGSWESIAKLCRANVWLLVMGFIMSVGVMVFKMAYYIVVREKIDKKVQMLYFATAIIPAVEIILLVFWTTHYSITRETSTFLKRSVGDFTYLTVHSHCSVSYGWMMLFLVLNGMLLIVGSFFAWPSISRSSADEAKDSNYLALAFYVNLAVIVVIVPSSVMLNLNFKIHPDVFYGVLGIFMLICTVTTPCLLTIPKLMIVCHCVRRKSARKVLAPLTEFLNNGNEQIHSNPLELQHASDGVVSLSSNVETSTQKESRSRSLQFATEKTPRRLSAGRQPQNGASDIALRSTD